MGPQIGDLTTLEISDLAFGGEGVARAGDFVVFVPLVAVGETVEVEITERKPRFARAQLRRVVKSSPQRVAPVCPYFGQCGGCQYQHLAYAEQLAIKHKQIRDLFERIGGLDPSVIAPVIPCPQPYGYRNRIMIRSQWDKFKQGLNVGFIRSDSRLVIDIEKCPIAEPAINDQLREVQAHPPPKGGLKVVLRIPPPGWEVPPDSFFQNNFFLLPALVATVRDFFRSGGARHLADIYCGVGFFSMELAEVVESFVGVEYDALAVKAARRNAENRGITNGRFIQGTAEEVLPELTKSFTPSATAVLLDPPRKGALPATLALLREARPRQVIYVSCHPATMARDLKLLCEPGAYRLAALAPHDMFPQTQHVECVADLRLQE